MLSLQDGVVECILTRGKSIILSMAVVFLMFWRFYIADRGGFEVFHLVKLDILMCSMLSERSLTQRAGTMEGIKGLLYLLVNNGRIVYL